MMGRSEDALHIEAHAADVWLYYRYVRNSRKQRERKDSGFYKPRRALGSDPGFSLFSLWEEKLAMRQIFPTCRSYLSSFSASLFFTTRLAFLCQSVWQLDVKTRRFYAAQVLQSRRLPGSPLHGDARGLHGYYQMLGAHVVLRIKSMSAHVWQVSSLSP